MEDKMNELRRFEDLREWLMSQIDGSEETRGDDSLISHFINQIDALPSEMGTIPDAERKKVMDAQLASMPSVNPAEEYAHRNPLGGVARVFESMALRIRAGEPYADVLDDYGYQHIPGLGGVQSGATTIAESATVEPRGCPTPGSCSAVEELADLKQRLLPQFQGRAQRAEHERDAMLEQLIAARSATAAPVAKVCEGYRIEWVGDKWGIDVLPGTMLYAAPQAPPVEVAEPDRPDWARQLPGAELYDRAARYEYLRKLNPREFAALYDEALADERFDDLVDRYRDAEERPE
jgi:hypothetical protein